MFTHQKLPDMVKHYKYEKNKALEDGFMCSVVGNDHLDVCVDYYRNNKCQTCELLHPYIITEFGKTFIFDGQIIVVDRWGRKSIYSQGTFDQDFVGI